MVVFGYGLVIGLDGICVVCGYLVYIVEQVEVVYCKGLLLFEVVEIIDLGEYVSWLDFEWVVVNVYQCYCELDFDILCQDLLVLLVMQVEWVVCYCMQLFGCVCYGNLWIGGCMVCLFMSDKVSVLRIFDGSYYFVVLRWV